MKSLGTLLLAFFASTIVAGVVQNQLAVALGAREEFIAVMMLFVLSALTTTFAFGVALAVAKTESGINRAAFGLVCLMALVVVGFMIAGAIASRELSITAQDRNILVEILVPTAVMIAIQWWIVRRRWRKANA